MEKKLDPELKAKWLAALRSGEYKQGRYCLSTDNGFCCLGVLCDIVKDDVGYEWVPGNVSLKNYFAPKGLYSIIDEDLGDPDDHTASSIFIPSDLKFSFVNSVYLDYGDTNKTLSGHNDYNDLSFDQIADLIEQQL